MNKVIPIILMTLLVGCGADNKIADDDYLQRNLPKELSDCTAYSGGGISIVRCPNSNTTTTFRRGKSNRSVAVVDNTTYEKVDIPKQEDTILIKGELYKKVEKQNE